MKSVVKIMMVSLLALLGLVPMARAQDYEPYPGGVTLLTRTFDPQHPTQSIVKPVFGDAKLLNQVINAGWQAGRASIDAQIIAQLGVPNTVTKDITLYDIVSHVGDPGDLSVQTGSYESGSTVNLRYLVHGNSVECTSTQPTVLGKWADPRFSVVYDLELTMAMNVADASGAVRMTRVTARILNPKLDSHGIVADTVFIANDVSKFFKGPNFIQKAQDAISGQSFDFTAPLNKALAPFNSVLTQYGGQGFAVVNSLVEAGSRALPGGLSTRSLPGASPSGPQLMMFLSNDGKTPTRGDGQISGAIRWNKDLGAPQEQRANSAAMHPFARAFQVRAVAQSGFAREGTFTPPMTEVGVLKSVTLDSSSSPRAGAGPDNQYVLRYIIDQLPLNVPIKVEIKMNDNVAWQGDIGNQQRVVGPTNWRGVITLRPGVNRLEAILKTLPVDDAEKSMASLPEPQRTMAIQSYRLQRATQLLAAAQRDDVMLNPQPLPPRPVPDRSVGRIILAPRNKVALNPQPLPPGPDGSKSHRSIIIIGGKQGQVALNPQPLPPRLAPGKRIVMKTRLAHAGVAASSGSEIVDYGGVKSSPDHSQSEVNTQNVVGARNQAATVAANVLKAQNDAAKQAQQNIGGGGGNANAGRTHQGIVISKSGVFGGNSDSIGISTGAANLQDILSQPRENPTGVLAVSDIDFDLALLTGPH